MRQAKHYLCMPNQLGNTPKSAQWITGRFLDWQKKMGGRRTVTEFAEHLGVSRDTLNKWMNGTRTPAGKHIDMLASKLGSEIYDVLDLRRPVFDFSIFDLFWDHLSEEQQDEVLNLMRGFAEKNDVRKPINHPSAETTKR